MSFCIFFWFGLSSCDFDCHAAGDHVSSVGNLNITRHLYNDFHGISMLKDVVILVLITRFSVKCFLYKNANALLVGCTVAHYLKNMHQAIRRCTKIGKIILP
jgi:hypothetical protein